MTEETYFINLLRKFATHPAARGLGDDSAVLQLGDEKLVLTHDMMAEGTHWLPDTDPADIAWKLLAVNLSDLAAKGAEPLGILLGYTLRDNAWNSRFAMGLQEALAHYDVPLLGGDTIGISHENNVTASQSIGITAIGRATAGHVPSRSGALAGDILYITGPVGDARAGFDIIKNGLNGPETLKQAYLRPRALISEGRMLAPLVHAIMDVSDGVLLDARRMADASGLAVHIAWADIPLSNQLADYAFPHRNTDPDGWNAPDHTQGYICWGDDYQLLFAAAKDTDLPIEAKAIGHFAQGSGLHITWRGEPETIDKPGYLHG